MKKIFCLLLVIFSVATHAQNLSGEANGILDKLAVQYKKYPSVFIRFTIRIEEGSKETAKMSGDILVKENMYKMTIPGQTIYCDGETIWTYQKEINEISIFEYDDSDETMINPIHLLNTWKDNYTAILIREELIDGRMLSLIDITPFRQQSYYKIRLFVDGAKNEIIGFTVYEKDNSVQHYNFDTVITSQTPQKSDFQLKKSDFPNAEINDMR